MLALLRMVFGFALFSIFARMLRVAGPYPETEGTTDAGYLALAVIIGIANAIVWAPLIGRLMADPLTGAFTSGNPADYTNTVIQFAHKLALRRRRRMALLFAFLEGVRHPDLPAAFVLGLAHARPGSWLEKVFAREVWKFDNAENCLRAWRVLRSRGIDPGLHRQAEVNLLILSVDRERRPDPSVLAVPPAPAPPPPTRNPRIRLFAGAPETPAPEATETEPSTSVASVGAGAHVPAPNAAAAADGAVAGEPPLAESGKPASSSPVVGAATIEGATPEAATRKALSWRERWRVLLTGRVRD